MKKPYTVGIVGASASGKTSFLRELVSRMPPGSCSVVSQDNYYHPLAEQALDPNGRHNFDLPTAIRRERFRADMQALLGGETIQVREYTFNQRDRVGALITVAPADVILIEGLFLFHFEEMRGLFDLRVFIDVREEICKSRRVERDSRERGYSQDHVEYQWQHHVLPAFRQFILPYRDEAHVVVANHAGYEKGLEVVADHVLAKVSRKS